MNLLVLTPADFRDDFPWEELKDVYVADTGALESYPVDAAESAATYVVTSDASSVPEELLDALADVIEVEDPIDYVISRGIPGDIACFAYDDSDHAYQILDRLNRSGVTVFDPDDEWVEVVIDKELSMEDLVNTITQRVTQDVLRVIRAELADTQRRGRFRSPAPRA